MSAVAPAAIYSLWYKIDARIPRAVLSGIVGDVAHSFGYHLARRDLPYNDYSVILALDKLGSSANASALDVSLPPDLMKICTARLLAAAKARDPRLKGLREFCGTTNGTTTHNYDLARRTEGFGQWDNSHLWHIHLSFYRGYAASATTLAPIADVMAGVPLNKSIEEEVMSYYTDKAHFEAAIRALVREEVHLQLANIWDQKTQSGHGIDFIVETAIADALAPIEKKLGV